MTNFLLKPKFTKTLKYIRNFEYIFLFLDFSKIICILKIRNAFRYLVAFGPKLLIFQLIVLNFQYEAITNSRFLLIECDRLNEI